MLDAASRKSGLAAAFAANSKAADGEEQPTVDTDGLLAVLRAVGLLHEACAAESEAFLRREVPGGRVALSPAAEAAFDALIAFEHGHGLSAAERAGRFPAVNAVEDEVRGASVLLCAVEAEAVARVEKLLLLGADPNSAAADGTTPLFAACKAGSAEAARALTFAGADPHAEVDRMGSTPLYIACHRGHAATVDELCLGGADPNRRSRDGSPPLHVAVKSVGLAAATEPWTSSHAAAPPVTMRLLILRWAGTAGGREGAAERGRRSRRADQQGRQRAAPRRRPRPHRNSQGTTQGQG